LDGKSEEAEDDIKLYLKVVVGGTDLSESGYSLLAAFCGYGNEFSFP